MNGHIRFIALMLCVIPQFTFGQLQPPPPSLGAAESFAIFTTTGALTNDGATQVTGNIGSNMGGVTGFPPGVLVGTIHDADETSSAAATAVCDAYAYLSGIVGGTVVGTALGSGQTLTPDVYILGAASTLNGELILDAENNPDAIFIFKIDGAFATTVGSSVTLINGALPSNVFWQISGAATLGEGSLFQGTILGKGAIHVLEAATLDGRGLTCAGAIDLHNNVISNGLSGALPITLIHFDAVWNKEGWVDLLWEIASERNADGFIVERSLDERTWGEIAKLSAQGSLDSRNEYRTKDMKPESGFNYYRLKMVDMDGTFEYSPLRSIFSLIKDRGLSTYPNPVDKELFISTDRLLEDVRVEIFTMQGKSVFFEKMDFLTQNGRTSILLPELSSGFYSVVISQKYGQVVLTDVLIKK